MRLEDDKLVQHCLDGDANAFGVLVHKYQEMVYAYAFQMVKNEADAKDIAQEVFLRAYRHLNKLKAPHQFRTWLYTIMSNECKRWLARSARDRQRQVRLEDTTETAAQVEPEHDQETGNGQIDLEEALSRLSADNRIAVSMFYMSDCSLKEIGEFLGVSANTVKGKLYRARQQLGRDLSKRYGWRLEGRKLTGGFLMQFMEKLQQIPHPDTSPTWQEQMARYIPHTVAVALCTLVGMLGLLHGPYQEQKYPLTPLGDTHPAIAAVEPVLLVYEDIPLKALESVNILENSDARVPKLANASLTGQQTAVQMASTLLMTASKTQSEAVSHPEDEKLALSLLNEAWELTEGKGYYARLSLLREMARMDSEMALELARTVDDATERDRAHALIIYTRLKIDPEDALPLLALIQNAETKAEVLAASARSMTQVSPEKAKRVLLEVLDILEETTLPRSRLYISLPVALAAGDLGMEQTQQQLVDIACEAARASGSHGLLRYAASQIAIVDPDVALSLAGDMQDIEHKYQAWADVITEMTRSDVHTAQASLSWLRSLIEPNSFVGEISWARAAKNVAIKLAESDVQAALKLARQIPEKQPAKAIALARIGAKMATQDKQEALRVFDEAIVSAHTIEDGGYPSRWVELARIGHILSTIDAERARKLFSQIPASRYKQVDQRRRFYFAPNIVDDFPVIAFYMAGACPEMARSVIKEIVSEASRYVVTEKRRAYMLRQAAQAAIRMDVVWAVEIARSIDPTDEAGAERQSDKAETLRKLAQYLLATPTDRQEINFRRWEASDTWTPGQPTKW